MAAQGPIAGTYSFQDMVAHLVGPGGMVSLGYGSGAADEGISIAYTEDRNNMLGGADGSVMHTLRCGKSGVITFNLLKISPTAKKTADDVQPAAVDVLGMGPEQHRAGANHFGRQMAGPGMRVQARPGHQLCQGRRYPTVGV